MSLRILVSLVVYSIVVLAQAPAFGVASVRRIAGRSEGIRQEITSTSLSMEGVSLGYCLRWAYGMRPYQTYQTAGPGWIDPPQAERYEIFAKTDDPVPLEQLKLMLQRLLADRFQLVLHREKRDLAVHALTLEKNESKLKPSENPYGEDFVTHPAVDVTECVGFSMARLAEFLTSLTGSAIVDETGLLGAFDFTLDCKPALDAHGHVDTAATVTRALAGIGLHLEAKQATVEELVVDHATREPRRN